MTRPVAGPTPRHGALPWLAVWLGAFAVRALYLVEIAGSPFWNLLLGDGQAYDAWARRLAAGDWLGSEVFFQAPLYPYFLGVLYRLFGPDLTVVRVVQIALGATSCVLVGRAAALLFGRAAGLIAGALVALDPTAIYFDGLVQKAVLDGFGFALVLFTLARAVAGGGTSGASWLAAGLALGLLGLSRENALLLVAAVLGWVLVARRDLRAGAAVVLGTALVLSPVAIRNAVVGGELVLTTSQLGPNLYIGNNPHADGTYRPLRWDRGNALYEREDARTLAEAAVGHALTPAEVSSYWVGRTLAFVREQPGTWLHLLLRKWLLVWNATELGDSDDQYTAGDFSLLLRTLTLVLHFGVLCPLAAAGVVLTWGERRRLGLFLLLGLAYAASVTLFFVFGRYRLPLVLLAVPFAAAAVVRSVALIRAGRGRALVPAGVTALAVALVVNWPLVSRDAVTAGTYYNLGGRMAEAGDTTRALEYLRTAVDRNPGFALAQHQLGAVLYRRGDVAGAVQRFDLAVQLRPEFVEARHNLAAALLRLGRADDAVEAARAALAADPSSRSSREILGRALLFSGRPAEAVTTLEPLVASAPDDAGAQELLAMALAEDGRLDEAIGHYRKAAAGMPDSAATRYRLGNALASADRLDEARPELEAALRLDPKLVYAHLDLAQVLRATGDGAGAAAHLRTALGLVPAGSEEAARIAALLADGGS